MIRPVFPVIFLAMAVCPFVSQAQASKPLKQPVSAVTNPEKFFETFPYDKKVLSPDEVDALNTDYGEFGGGMGTFARAVIFGRHGRVFQDKEIQGVLADTKWYKPNPRFNNSMLNATERKNLDFVRGAESNMHPYVQPGDLRFWEERDIPKSGVWNSTIVELHIMRAEIEAVHGKKFEDEPWLQKYFEDRYWYKPAPHYDPSSLNAHEKANMALLTMAEAKKSGNTLVPGALLAYGEKPMRPELVKNLNLYQLRLLRNEIYAIRGSRFHTQWLQDHFDGEDWYSPLPKGKDPQLTALDQKNVAVILKREGELHQSLSVKKIKASDLNGMLSDDARRLKDEIYARRGKVFKDKWLQGYFVSMSWYKANPGYSDKLLTAIEKQNIKTIAKYEMAATAQEDMTEG
jgi:hypothetical protein